MNEEKSPLDGSQEPTLNSEIPAGEPARNGTSAGMKAAVAFFVILAVMATGYAWLQHATARQLADQRAQLATSLSKAQSQEDALAVRVSQLNAAQAQDEAALAQKEAEKKEQFPPRTHEAERRASHHRVVSRPPADDPRWAQVQRQLGEQQTALTQNQEQIAQTQSNLQEAKLEMDQNLQSARTELGGGIARNHDELVVLRRQGERNYYEFGFEKSKAYHHAGPISIALRKADQKHQYCDLQLIVDDQEITRKHVNLYEAVDFYPQGYSLPLEVVINGINKDAVQGYVSEPKYRPTVQAATPAPPPNATSSSATVPVAPDAKLVHRDQPAQ